ncbi:MAG: hypothetical protein WC885_03685 [Candidatus Shapirobacteria bacterium]
MYGFKAERKYEGINNRVVTDKVKWGMWVIMAMVIGIAMLIASYFFTDMPLVLMIEQSKPGIEFLNKIIEYGGMHRQMLAFAWGGIVLFLLGMQIYLVTRKSNKTRGLRMAGLILAVLAAASYPFLSKDIYTYIFSAKMVVDYGVNPYLVPPNTFLGKDLWLDLMGSVERPYFYGPVYLGLSIVPLLILGTNRVITVLASFKIINLVFFIIGGWAVEKLVKDKNRAMAMWWFSPLLLIELLVNGHNDLVMITLFLLGMVWLEKRKIFGWVVFLMSMLSKWISAGLLPIVVAGKYRNQVAGFMAIGMFYFLMIRGGQAWYWTWMFMLLPLIEIKDKKSWVAIFIFQVVLMFGYISFVVTKKWGEGWEVLYWVWKFGYLLPVVVWWWERSHIPAKIKTREIS